MSKAQAINRAWEKWPSVDVEVVAELVSAGWDAAKAAKAVPVQSDREALIEAASMLMQKHYLDPEDMSSCICGRWGEGEMEPGWDDHLAEELADAGFLAAQPVATAREATDDQVERVAEFLYENGWRGRRTWRADAEAADSYRETARNVLAIALAAQPVTPQAREGRVNKEHVAAIAEAAQLRVQMVYSVLWAAADLGYAFDLPAAQPVTGTVETVCICGSTRFRAEMTEANRSLTMQGYMVLAPGVFGHDGDPLTDDDKVRLDKLHFAKIHASDLVHVVNPGGYIGESTRREIDYALSLGKPVTYRVEVN
jgi:hypothetical protein